MPDQVIESAASPEVQAKAEKMGWIPPARFNGDPERFVDADAYIERGETVLPIVKEHNRRLEAELASVKSTAAATAKALKEAQLAIEQIEERHSVETQRAVERAKAAVKAQLAAASREGDHEGVAELTDQLTQLNAAQEEPAPVAKKDVPTPPPLFVPPPDLVAWNDENRWFGTDKRKTALALAIGEELRAGGETSTGRTFFDKISAELERTLGGPPTPPPTKVEGGRNGSESTLARGGSSKGFAALPADAKEACDADARKFVGPNKRYKTQDEWRKRYAEIYFEGS